MDSTAREQLLILDTQASTLLDARLLATPDHYSENRAKYYGSIDRIIEKLSPRVIEASLSGEKTLLVRKGRFNTRAIYAPIVYTALAQELEPEGIEFKVFAKKGRLGFKENTLQFTELNGETLEAENDLANNEDYVQIWPPVEGTSVRYSSI